MKITILLSGLVVCFCLNSMEIQDPSVQSWDGKAFYKATKGSLPFAKKILDTYPLASYEAILDVGSGSGTLTAYMAKKAKKAGSKTAVAGFEPNRSMFLFAQGYYQKPDNLYFCEFALPKIFNHWDFICTINMLHLLPLAQQSAALKTLASCAQTQKNVPLLVIMAAKNNVPQAFERAYAATLGLERWKKLRAIKLEDYFAPHDDRSFRQMAQDTGWVVKKTEMQNEEITFKNVKRLKQFITSWMGGFEFVAQMPCAEQEQLLTDLVENYKKQEPAADDESIKWSSPRLIVHAEKPKAC